MNGLKEIRSKRVRINKNSGTENVLLSMKRRLNIVCVTFYDQTELLNSPTVYSSDYGLSILPKISENTVQVMGIRLGTYSAPNLQRVVSVTISPTLFSVKKSPFYIKRRRFPRVINFVRVNLRKVFRYLV